jgi:hypothetical protein
VLEQADTQSEFNCLQSLVESNRHLEGRLSEEELKYEGLNKAHNDALQENEKWMDIKKREEEVRNR